jgi:hypothetical protein
MSANAPRRNTATVPMTESAPIIQDPGQMAKSVSTRLLAGIRWPVQAPMLQRTKEVS